jgi:L-amino acid N-acyltransferase YncA
MTTTPLTIRQATADDWPFIWDIFSCVIATGSTYIYPDNITSDEALSYWNQGDNQAYVALENNIIVGTYVLRPNKPGRGSHVANAGFMVHPDHRSKSIGRLMGKHALQQAKSAGYRAMQFNMVVSTNTHSIALWKSLDFTIIGTIPKGFDHKTLGLVDIHIMHRFL